MPLDLLLRRLIRFTIFYSHRHRGGVAPVPDGKQEGGQHVLHDLVHQLVLNWSWFSRGVWSVQEGRESVLFTCGPAAAFTDLWKI